VFVESESRKIGTLQVPETLLAAMRASACVRVATPQPLRVALLKEEYAHFLADPDALAARLALLVPLHGRAAVERWNALARAGDFDTRVGELLVRHYDPMYARSIERNFPRIAQAHVAAPSGLAAGAFDALARDVVRAVDHLAPETTA
jgi:tRNA 2-selenouridine synthase